MLLRAGVVTYRSARQAPQLLSVLPAGYVQDRPLPGWIHPAFEPKQGNFAMRSSHSPDEGQTKRSKRINRIDPIAGNGPGPSAELAGGHRRRADGRPGPATATGRRKDRI